MLTNFIMDTSSGPTVALGARGPWVLTAFIVLNELRGFYAAYEGIQRMGWI